MDIQIITSAPEPFWKDLLPVAAGLLGGAAVFCAQWIRDAHMKKAADSERRASVHANALREAYTAFVGSARDLVESAGQWAFAFVFKHSPLAAEQPAEQKAELEPMVEKHRAALDGARAKLRAACVQLLFWERDKKRLAEAESFEEAVRKLGSELLIGDGHDRKRFDDFGTALGAVKKRLERFIEGVADDERLKIV